MLKEKQYSCKQEEFTITKELKQLENTARILKESLENIVEILKEVSLLRIANLTFLDLELLANLG